MVAPMSSRERRIQTEASSLWRELYHEPPPDVEGGRLLELMLGRLPAASYERLTTPRLRHPSLTWPKRSAR